MFGATEKRGADKGQNEAKKKLRQPCDWLIELQFAVCLQQKCSIGWVGERKSYQVSNKSRIGQDELKPRLAANQREFSRIKIKQWGSLALSPQHAKIARAGGLGARDEMLMKC